MTIKKLSVPIPVIIAILGAYLLGGGATNSSPAMQSIANAFPDVSYSIISLVTTLPNLSIVLGSLTAGAIAGTKVRIKPLLITAGAIYAVGGVMTCFVHSSIAAILVTRAVFGLGVGLATPLGLTSAYTMISDGDDCQTVAGWGSVVQNIISIVGVIIAGRLCMIRWEYTFYVYLIGAAGLFMVAFFMPNTPITKPAAGDGTKARPHLTASAYLLSAVLMLFMTLVFPLYVNMSSIVAQRGIGDASTTGTILAFFNLGGIFAGLIYGSIYKLTKKFIIPLSLFLAAGSFLVIYFADSVALLILATFFTGITSVFMIPGIMAEIHKKIDQSAVAMASGVMMAAMNLGGFLVSGYYAVLEKVGIGSPLTMLMTSALLLVMLGIIVSVGSAKLARKGERETRAR